MTKQLLEIETSGPRYMRVPSPNKSDPIFGLRRGWYYAAEAKGLLKFRRVNMPGRTRGIVLVRVAEIESLIENGKVQK